MAKTRSIVQILLHRASFTYFCNVWTGMYCTSFHSMYKHVPGIELDGPYGGVTSAQVHKTGDKQAVKREEDARDASKENSEAFSAIPLEAFV